MASILTTRITLIKQQAAKLFSTFILPQAKLTICSAERRQMVRVHVGNVFVVLSETASQNRYWILRRVSISVRTSKADDK
jgi:hypothetical protein